MPNWPAHQDDKEKHAGDAANDPSALLLASVRQLQRQFGRQQRQIQRLEAREGFRSACCPACSLVKQDAACRRMQGCFSRAVLRGRRVRAAAERVVSGTAPARSSHAGGSGGWATHAASAEPDGVAAAPPLASTAPHGPPSTSHQAQ